MNDETSPVYKFFAFTKSQSNPRYIPSNLNLDTSLTADHISHVGCKMATSHTHALSYLYPYHASLSPTYTYTTALKHTLMLYPFIQSVNQLWNMVQLSDARGLADTT